MDAAMLQEQVTGLEAMLEDLRGKERLFIRAQGLDEETQKARADADKLGREIEAAKPALAKLKADRAAAVAATARALAEAMSQLLPEGTAVFDISEDGKVFLGWALRPDRTPTPYAGLSGGQKAAFDAALAFSLLGRADNRVIILEAAELDPERLTAVLERLTGLDAQVIVNSCHPPASVPEGWQVVELGGTA